MTTDCPFEIVGYFEEFIDATSYKFLGIRPVTNPDRPLGSPGMREYTWTENVELVKPNVKRTPVTVRASKQFPVKVLGMVQAITGRTKTTK